MAPHRSDFTFRTGMFDAEPPVRGGQPQRITAQRWHEVRVELTTASATYWVDGRTFATATLRPGEWWRARVPRGTHPLSITVELTHSAACQPRYVAADGKCAFALRLYGSAEAPPTATAFDQLDEDQRRSGDDYSLEVSACTLRAAPPNASGYHVAVVGWDGTNSFIVRAEQMRVPLATSVCPALSGPGRPPREPEPRHSHAAVWLPADQRMVIFGGETLQTRRSFGPRPAGPADHNADELRRMIAAEPA